MNTFKTPKGTELPFLNLKGKDYLQVAHRVVWFREDHPDWCIETHFLQLTPECAVAKAIIKDAEGKVIAQGTKAETPESFRDGYIEKAESGAVGRALAFCGYGTAFAQELDEGERVVDGPQGPKSKANLSVVGDPGAYVIKLGKKLLGKRLDAVDIYELDGFSKYLQGQKRDALGDETMAAVEAFLKGREVKKGGA